MSEASVITFYQDDVYLKTRPNCEQFEYLTQILVFYTSLTAAIRAFLIASTVRVWMYLSGGWGSSIPFNIIQADLAS